MKTFYISLARNSTKHALSGRPSTTNNQIIITSCMQIDSIQSTIIHDYYDVAHPLVFNSQNNPLASQEYQLSHHHASSTRSMRTKSTEFGRISDHAKQTIENINIGHDSNFHDRCDIIHTFVPISFCCMLPVTVNFENVVIIFASCKYEKIH